MQNQKRISNPKRSLDDNNTWEALAYDISNINYSTQTIFKLSNPREINLTPMSFSTMLYSSLNTIKPLYLYDNIVFGVSNNRPALVIGERSSYCEDELLKSILQQECPLPVAKTVIGNEVANFIRQMLDGSYHKSLSTNQFIALCDCTSKFDIKEVNSEITNWICDELEKQVGIEQMPEKYKNEVVAEWRNSYPIGTYKYKKDFNIKWIYSIGCFLEHVLY